MGCYHVVHSHSVNFFKDKLIKRLIDTEFLCIEIATENSCSDNPLRTDLGKDGGLCNLEVLRGNRHVLDDLVEALDSLLELIVLRSDIGKE